jgi:hypothetical protein
MQPISRFINVIDTGGSMQKSQPVADFGGMSGSDTGRTTFSKELFKSFMLETLNHIQNALYVVIP